MSDRTDSQILASEPVDVSLGGAVYQIAPPPRKHCREFHRQLADAMRNALAGSEILNVLRGASDLRSVSLADIAPSILAFLGSYADDLLDLIYVYSPTLADARDAIEEKATTAEMLVALTACVRLEFAPFVPAISRIADLTGMLMPAQMPSADGTA